MSSHCNPSVVDDGLVFLYDVDDIQSYKGEPVVNIWSEQNGGDVNLRGSWQKPKAYNGEITESVYTGGTWSGNRIWEVLHTAGTSGYGDYESWRLCVNQPLAGSYSSTRRVAIKICILEGSISDLAIHSGGGNASHNSSYFTAIPESQVPRDCPIKSGWYQFLSPANWTSTTVGHCVGLGFISYNRVKILTAEPMYYPSDHLIPFSGTERTATQGLIDRTGNETIDLSNVSFDSNADITFDGTDDFIPLVDNPQNGDNSVSWEFITKFDLVHDNETSTYRQLYIQESSVWIGQYYDYIGIDLKKDNNAWFDGNGGRVTSSKIGPVNSGEYYHVVFTWDGTNVKGYLNSELGFTTAISGLTGIRNGVSPRRIGRRSGNPLIGKMPIVKLYNRALTAAEVLKNFNATKSRFGL